MQVTLDSSDNDFSLGFDFGFREEGVQDIQPGVHCSGGYQNFGDKDFIVLELLTDDMHSRH